MTNHLVGKQNMKVMNNAANTCLQFMLLMEEPMAAKVLFSII